jgi:hypothetical protein
MTPKTLNRYTPHRLKLQNFFKLMYSSKKHLGSISYEVHLSEKKAFLARFKSISAGNPQFCHLFCIFQAAWEHICLF